MSLEQITQWQTEATSDSASKLQSLAETAEDKATVKAAKRALYLLAQKGIVPDVKQPTNPPVKIEASSISGDPLRVYASAYDGEGNSIVLFVEADKDGGSPYVTQVLVNDVGGIRNFGGGKLARQELKERVERFQAQLENGIAFVEITPDEGRRILQQAHSLHHRAGQLSPRGFIEWAEHLGVELKYAPETVLNLPEELTAQEFPETPDTKALFQFPYFETWFLDAELGMGILSVLYGTGKFSAENTEEERDEAMQATMRNAAENVFTLEVRSIIANRLEYSASLLWRLDKKDAAALAYAHAKQLRTETPSADIEFARAICERTMWAAYEIYKREQQEKGK